MRKFLTVALSTIALTALSGTAGAAPCKDTHGKFIKCPPAAPAKVAAAPKVIAKPAMAKAAPAPRVVKATPKTAARGHCRDAKGRFASCAAPGAKPA